MANVSVVQVLLFLQLLNSIIVMKPRYFCSQNLHLAGGLVWAGEAKKTFIYLPNFISPLKSLLSQYFYWRIFFVCFEGLSVRRFHYQRGELCKNASCFPDTWIGYNYRLITYPIAYSRIISEVIRFLFNSSSVFKAFVISEFIVSCFKNFQI